MKKCILAVTTVGLFLVTATTTIASNAQTTFQCPSPSILKQAVQTKTIDDLVAMPNGSMGYHMHLFGGIKDPEGTSWVVDGFISEKDAPTENDAFKYSLARLQTVDRISSQSATEQYCEYASPSFTPSNTPGNINWIELTPSL